jgi:REP element-mobilizing transposase RayT/DNA-binding response OmpR family regulator
MNILVITPYTSFGESLRLSLEERGDFLIELPQTGQEALASSKKTSFELIILDAAVEDQPFIELGKKLQSILPEAKIIVIPPNNDPNDPAMSGFKPDAFLNRPFYLPDFLTKLEILFNINLSEQRIRSPQQKKHTFQFKTEHSSIELYPWLLSEPLTRDYLTYLLSSTPAVASVVLTHDGIYATAGKWQHITPDQVKSIILSNWSNSDGFDLAKFITIGENKETILIYVSVLSKGYLLAALFQENTTLSVAHAKTNLIIHGLKSSPPQTILEVHADLELEEMNLRGPEGLEATLQRVSQKDMEEAILADDFETPSSTNLEEKEKFIFASDQELEALFNTPSDETLVDDEESDTDLEEQINLIRLLENMPSPDPTEQSVPEKLEWISEEESKPPVQTTEKAVDEIDEPILPWEEESLDLPLPDFSAPGHLVDDDADISRELPEALGLEFTADKSLETLTSEEEIPDQDFETEAETLTREEIELPVLDFEIGEVDEFLDAIPIAPIVTNLPENGHLETDEKQPAAPDGQTADQIAVEPIQTETPATFSFEEIYEESPDQTADHLETSLLDSISADRLPTSLLDQEKTNDFSKTEIQEDFGVAFPWDTEVLDEKPHTPELVQHADLEKKPAFTTEDAFSSPFSEMDLELPWEKPAPKKEVPETILDEEIDLDAWLDQLEKDIETPPAEAAANLEDTQPIHVKPAEDTPSEEASEDESIKPIDMTTDGSESTFIDQEDIEEESTQPSALSEDEDASFEDFLRELEHKSRDEDLSFFETTDFSEENAENELDMLFKDFEEDKGTENILEVPETEKPLPDNFISALENAEAALMMDEQFEELDRYEGDDSDEQKTSFKPLNLANTQPLRPLEQVKKTRRPVKRITSTPIPVFDELKSEEEMPKTSLLAYSCVMVPRTSGAILVNEIADSMNEWLPDIFNQQSWTLKSFSIYPEYIHWVISAAAEISPKALVKKISDETTLRFREYYPDKTDLLSEGEFWAAEYLILSSSHPPYSKLVKDFINKIHKTP